ncbi:unnamed protein product [Phaedon cochleariae]|uniref:Uncharacterized protein n=1 Tax=Phaedon cochleariae TaxID=80249 RepID=A0A9N9X0M1_PHACE|nr:unnamed protein product [Phaedon cochleariae]
MNNWAEYYIHASLAFQTMFAVLTFSTLAAAKESAAKSKRGVAGGTSLYASPGPAYTKSQQAPQAQAYAYAAQPQPQLQPQPQHIRYSSAADVSSFSYSSPVVEYNNLGLLHQLAGKNAPSQASQSYNVAPSPKAQYTSPAPRVQYVSSPKVQYTSPSKSQYNPRIQYTSDAGSSSGAPSYEDIYQQLIQRAEQSQNIAYQPVAQKVSYAQAVSPAAYQAKEASSHINYEAPSQQYYQQSQTAPIYEHQAQSSAQGYYSQAAAPEQQYYSAPSQSKYAKAGITYA